MILKILFVVIVVAFIIGAIWVMKATMDEHYFDI